MGGKGSYIQLHGTEGKWGCYVVEVPGAGALNAEKHLYEEIYYVVEGRGSTEVWLDNDTKRHVFEWQKGSLFSIPVNAWHRIVNASSAPALLLAGTTAPNLMNLINNVDAIFNCPYEFRDRFSGADDFYKYKDDIEPDPVRGLAMRRTNFVPDIVNCDLPLDNRRSPGWRRVEPFMTGNTFYLWIGQHENGRYSKAHAHTSAAVLICLKGKGYTYTWPERYGVNPWKDGHADKIKRVDYEPVGMVSAAPGGARWFHQHFGASKDPLRLTAWFGPHNPGREPGPPGEKHTDYTAMDIPEGGSAIPYWMEDPFISQRIRGEAAGRRRRRTGWSPNSTRRARAVPKFCRRVQSRRNDRPEKPAGASSSPRPAARWSRRTRSSSSASASTSAPRPRIWCSRASCWSGSTAATSSPSREAFYQSDILLTPYAAAEEIDADALGAFIAAPVRGRRHRSRRDRHRRADPDRRRGAPAQCARDRRTVRPPGRQDGRGLAPATAWRPSWRRTARARPRARSATRRPS